VVDYRKYPATTWVRRRGEEAGRGVWREDLRVAMRGGASEGDRCCFGERREIVSGPPIISSIVKLPQ
jgi:hypothetical protein